jgi:hypothetical protein
MLIEALVRDGLDYASGTADREAAAFDMSFCNQVLGIVKLAAVASSAVTDIRWQQADDSSFSVNVETLAGTSISIADDDDNQVFASMLIRPTRRYVRIVINKDASNATAEVVVYVGLDLKKAPGDNSEADVTYEKHVSPASGTP